MQIEPFIYPQVKPAVSLDLLAKLVMVRDCIDSVLADKPADKVEDNLYWSRQLIVTAIREAAAKIPAGVA